MLSVVLMGRMDFTTGSRRICVRSLLSFALLCLCYSQPVLALDFILGLSVQQSEITVYEEDETRELAVLESSIELYPAFALRTKERYFRGGESNWGWFVETGIGYYDVDEQQVGGSTKDLGTGLDGFYAHVVPTLFYRWDSRVVDDLDYKLGFGLGPGWLSADGDVILTRVEGDPRIEIDSSESGFAWGIFYEMSLNNWVAQLKAYGPEHSVSGYDLQLLEYRLVFGRSFTF